MNKERIVITKIKNRPVLFSIFFSFVLAAIWTVATLFIRGLYEQFGTSTLLFMNIMVGTAITVLAVALFGVINQTNGFKHLFKIKGFMKGLFVLLPVVPLVIFGLVIGISGEVNTDMENVWVMPLAILLAVVGAFMQSALFRGLLATALFMKFSGTEKERVLSVFKASALFLVLYIMQHILSGNHISIMQLINTFIVGAGFCAAYLYSRNLMSLVLFQGIWLTIDSVINLLFVNVNQVSPLTIIPLALILILIVVFTVRFSKRAERFTCSAEIVS